MKSLSQSNVTKSKPKKSSSSGKILDDMVEEGDIDGDGHVWEGQGSMGL